MTVYRIRHKETGLFYKKSRTKVKSNLSDRGTIYTSRPDLKWTEQYFHPDDKHDNPWKRRNGKNEFEIVRYELVEK